MEVARVLCLRIGSRRREERGAAAVEFAIILPLLLVIVFGLIQYGFYFWAMQGGSAAAREAARSAAVGQPTDCTAFRTQVRTNIESMATGTPTIKRTFDKAVAGPVQVGDDVIVSVDFNSVDLGFPFVPFINDGRVVQTATARVDYVPDPTVVDCS